MAHELSMTFEIDGKFVNVKSVMGGETLTGAEAFRRAVNIGDNIIGTFSTMDEAVKAAEKRSRDFGKTKGR